MKLQSGLVLLKESMPQLPEAERKAARFLLDRPQQAIMSTITEVARESGSSISAIVRLCKRLGIKGFAELKIRITWDISQNIEPRDFHHIKPGLTIPDIAHSVIHNNREAMDNILRILDVETLDRAADRILASQRIDVYGVGASSIVAQDLLLKLLRIGLHCSHYANSHVQLTSACGLGPNDTAIAISYSGSTDEVVRAAKAAGKCRAATIGITRYGDSKLAECCDLNLYVPSNEPLFRESAMVSRIAQLVLVDILFSVVASKRFESARAHITRVLQTLRKA